MRTLILNSTNIIQDGQNNKLVYKFPNSVIFKDSYISMSQAQIYYSWFNITSDYGNNTFQYIWINNLGVYITYNIVIPDGLYEIVQLNQYLQYALIQNGHYLVDAAGKNVYYVEMLVNTSRYAIQINTYLFPTSLPLGWSNPSALLFPPQSFNPSIIIPKNFNIIVGYDIGFTTNINLNNTYIPAVSNYESKLTNGTLSYISTQAPNVQPNSSLIISMSNIDNQYAQPTGSLYSITATVSVGSIINEKPVNFIWSKLIPGTYHQLTITLLGNDLQPLKIQDPSMTFVFVIKNSNESIY